MKLLKINLLRLLVTFKSMTDVDNDYNDHDDGINLNNHDDKGYDEISNDPI